VVARNPDGTYAVKYDKWSGVENNVAAGRIFKYDQAILDLQEENVRRKPVVWQSLLLFIRRFTA
jgi:hypothetical protein